MTDTSRQTLLRSLPSSFDTGPQWLRALRVRAADALREQGLPTKKSEAWRFTPVRSLVDGEFSLAEAAVPSIQSSLPAGVTARRLRQVLESEPELLRGRLDLGGAPTDFAALNTALFSDGLWIDVSAGAVVEALSGTPRLLGALARHFGSDKWDDCDFTAAYTTHFAQMRRARVRLLEIGIGGFEAPDRGGESLRMWKHAFPRGIIFGLDLFDKTTVAEPRIVPLRGDQSDAKSLVAIEEAYGPFDIIIDDGSHISTHVRTSFETLFPRLADNGIYAIEDLQTSYWPGWNNCLTGHDKGSTMGLIKTLLDGLHYQDRIDTSSDDSLALLGRSLRAVHVYRNLVVIEKGANLGSTAPSWVRRDRNDMDLSPKGSMRRL